MNWFISKLNFNKFIQIDDNLVNSGILLFIKNYESPIYDKKDNIINKINKYDVKTLKYNINKDTNNIDNVIINENKLRYNLILLDDKYINQLTYHNIDNKTQINIKLLKSEHLEKLSNHIRNNKYNFSNLIGINSNAKAPYVLLGAHIDSPQIDGCESTIDSVTGIVVILELAKNLLKINPNLPIIIVFVDGEEAIDGKWSTDNTLSGSNYFVNNYDLSLINKVYIFDLIGGDIEKNKLAAFSNNIQTYNDFEKLAKINLKYDKQIFLSPSTFVSTKGIVDDHVPFKEKGIYAMNLIPYDFPDSHHTLKDNYDNVNWEYVEIFYNVFYDFLNN
jgi:Zn-dependent M28 family amino/carboxypeptidase